MKQRYNTRDHTAAFAAAFFIGNLLFVGAFYLALWLLYFFRYEQASVITRHHLQQALLGSSISTSIFIAINIFIILTSGYASVTALFSLEFYFMLLLPMFLVVGILAFTKAVKGLDFSYPLIGRFLKKPVSV
ncbi:MAG TPA: hypothetical protein ENJ87_11675 [Gammaproteobacteria bacterium]|nr:hypothetical protein [Gammaproteobacteria bacterium]